MGYDNRQYTGKTGVKEVASHVLVVILGIRPLRRANGSGAGTLSESLPCGRQEIFNPPAGEGLRLSVPVLLFIYFSAFFPLFVSQLFFTNSPYYPITFLSPSLSFILPLSSPSVLFSFLCTVLIISLVYILIIV